MDRPNSTHVISTYQGGQDAASLETICWQQNGVIASSAATNGFSNTYSIEGTAGTILPVGHGVTFAAGPNSHIVGVGSFNNGTRQVLVDSYI